ncbi:uncharacterized protein B4U80_14249, partial [Leptotrombidium deliense]
MNLILKLITLLVLFLCGLGITISVFRKLIRSPNQLKSVMLIHRHGERVPTLTYNDDPNVLYWVKFGIGSLTDKGEQRMRHLGEFLRERYESLWPEKNELYVRSSAYKEDFLSNPVKIYNVDAQNDFMLSFDFNCPVFDKETERVLKSPDYFEWLKSYTPLLLYLEKNIGARFDRTITTTSRLFDNFLLSKKYNLTFPNWITDTIYEQMREFRDRFFDIHSRSILQKRLRAGAFLKELEDQMKLIESNKNFKKVHIYSS